MVKERKMVRRVTMVVGIVVVLLITAAVSIGCQEVSRIVPSTSQDVSPTQSTETAPEVDVIEVSSPSPVIPEINIGSWNSIPNE